MTETNERHCVNGRSVVYREGPLPDGKTEVKVLPERETSSLLEKLLGGK